MTQRNNLVRHLLTMRQLEILDLTYKDELTPERIADKLCIDRRTVQFHQEKIRQAYKVPSFTMAVIKYIKELE